MNDTRAADPPRSGAAGEQEKLPDRGVKISLREQAEEAGRELQMRYKVYSVRVKKGSMTEAEKAAGIGVMRAIRDTLRLFARFEPAVRETLEYELAREREEKERASREAADSGETSNQQKVQ